MDEAAGTTANPTIWDGVTRRQDYQDRPVEARDELADAAHRGDWPAVLSALDRNSEWVNSCRIGGDSGFTPLHQAAWHGAPADVARRLVEMGAWRTLRTARGDRAVDIADRKGHRHLHEPLTPVIRHQVPSQILDALQGHLHTLIRERARDLVTEQRLPELEPLTELVHPHCWFAVPGMYGGFSYRLNGDHLIVESWSRVLGGSGQRHVIDERGTRLVADGFV